MNGDSSSVKREHVFSDFSKVLQENSLGIWTVPSHADFGFATDDATDWVAIEDQSYWYRHRLACFAELLGRVSRAGEVVFEVGAGNGHVSRGLQDAGYSVFAVEPTVRWAQTAKGRGVRNVACAYFESAEFADLSIPNAGMFDVLEHMPSPESFLGVLHAKMRKGGVLICAVPAHRFLWSLEDVQSGHQTRFNADQLKNLLSPAGFDVVYSTYLFLPLVAPLLLLRSLPYRLGMHRTRTHASSQQDHVPQGIVRRAIDLLLRLELGWIKWGWRIPLGTTVVAIARAR